MKEPSLRVRRPLRRVQGLSTENSSGSLPLLQAYEAILRHGIARGPSRILAPGNLEAPRGHPSPAAVR